MGRNMIDWAHLYGLRADIGSDVFSEVIGLFLAEADGAMELLAQPECDIPLILHMLKGSALAVGLTELAAQCGDGERRAAAGAMPQLGRAAEVYRESRSALLLGLGQVNLVPQQAPVETDQLWNGGLPAQRQASPTI